MKRKMFRMKEGWARRGGKEVRRNLKGLMKRRLYENFRHICV